MMSYDPPSLRSFAAATPAGGAAEGAAATTHAVLLGARAPTDRASRRMVHVDPASERITVRPLDALITLLAPGDVVVVNDAATLPARLVAELAGLPVELRLLALPNEGQVDAVLLSPGSHRVRTEDRPAPVVPRVGDVVDFGSGTRALVTRIDPASPRRVRLLFACPADDVVRFVYRAGRPIQYAHVPERIALWDVQNVFAGAPWAVEMPSASRGITFERLVALRARGVEVVHLTHGAGISSTGDDALDRKLPFTERYLVPRSTADTIAAAKARGSRVIASGTSVVRALESSALGTGKARPGADTTDLRLSPGSRLSVVDGLLTGIHEPNTSHHELVSAFAPVRLVDRALEIAAESGLTHHEFGDFMFVLAARG